MNSASTDVTKQTAVVDPFNCYPPSLFDVSDFRTEEKNWRSPLNRTEAVKPKDLSSKMNTWQTKSIRTSFPLKTPKQTVTDLNLYDLPDSYDDDDLTEISKNSQETSESTVHIEQMLKLYRNANNSSDNSLPKEKSVSPCLWPESSHNSLFSCDQKISQSTFLNPVSVSQNKHQPSCTGNYCQSNCKLKQYQCSSSPTCVYVNNNSDTEAISHEHSTFSGYSTLVSSNCTCSCYCDTSEQHLSKSPKFSLEHFPQQLQVYANVLPETSKSYHDDSLKITNKEERKMVHSFYYPNEEVSTDPIINHSNSYVPCSSTKLQSYDLSNTPVCNSKPTSPSDLKLYPSTYSVERYHEYKVPSEYIKTNKFYPNTIYKKHMANSASTNSASTNSASTNNASTKLQSYDLSNIPVCNSKPTSPSDLELYPSTYSVERYYECKVPSEYIKTNKFYSNTIYKKHMANSFDNLLDIGSPDSICDKYRFKSQELYSSPPQIKGSRFLSLRRRSSTLVPEYDLKKFLSSDVNAEIIDTHCHLDFLFQRESHTNSFNAYRNKNEATFPPCFGGCVTNFCDPDIYPKKSNWGNLLKEENVWGGFGVHPNNVKQFDEQVHYMLSEILCDSKVVAVGEIGLDYSRRFFNKELQKKIFEVQLKMAVDYKKPIIIHCRDAKEDCLEILRKMVPKETFIHRHCFTGDWEEAQLWLDAFPNLFIGITALVTYSDATSVHEVAKNIPLDRLLFETDAPYFVPEQVKYTTVNRDLQGKKLSHPGMVIHVAAQIAALKGVVDISSFLATVRENTRKMYNI